MFSELQRPSVLQIFKMKVINLISDYYLKEFNFQNICKKIRIYQILVRSPMYGNIPLNLEV